MTMTSRELFQPFQLKSLKLKNRIAMAPMTRSFSPQGVPALNVADYYDRRVVGAVGLIISEGTAVNRPCLVQPYPIFGFTGEEALRAIEAGALRDNQPYRAHDAAIIIIRHIQGGHALGRKRARHRGHRDSVLQLEGLQLERLNSSRDVMVIGFGTTLTNGPPRSR